MTSLLFDYLRIVPRLRRKNHRDIQFNAMSLNWTGLKVQPTHYRRYADFFALDTAHVHPLYFYVLGQSAQLRLLGHPDFPFAPAGLVHLSNRVEVRHPFDPAEPYQLILEAQGLQWNIAGCELELTTRFIQNQQECVCNRTLALVRAPAPRNRETASATRERPRRELPSARFQPTVNLVIPVDAGRRYARVSGDYNPIHLAAWLARPFGFRQPIAHGMYSLMRVVSVLERQEGIMARQIHARFLRPVQLPSVAGLGHEFVGDECRFELSDANAHLLLAGEMR